MKQSLTAIVTTYNEEANIRDCLDSLSFADEILVVDSFSTDATVEIARAMPGVRLLQHEYRGNGPQCNWAMEQAAHPWILVVDADERVTLPLAREIEDLLSRDLVEDAYRLRRSNTFLGRVIRHSGWGKDRLVRLVRKGTVRYPEQRVHADIPLRVPAPTLRSPLLHDTFRSFGQYLEKLHRYAEWGAQDQFQRGRRAGLAEIALRPAWRFFRMYVVQAGFLDGVPGLIVCTLQSYGVFLKWARLWELRRGKDVGRRT
jgi:glycosyltransferase involved in cell wall biosynthesis